MVCVPVCTDSLLKNLAATSRTARRSRLMARDAEYAIFLRAPVRALDATMTGLTREAILVVHAFLCCDEFAGCLVATSHTSRCITLVTALTTQAASLVANVNAIIYQSRALITREAITVIVVTFSFDS